MTLTVRSDSLSHIRRVSTPEDLLAVADLVELAFDLRGDFEGQAVIRQMRRIARQRSPASIRASRSSSEGFVWIEDGQIVGNISLMYFSSPQKKRVLVANVAVSPSYQGQGIGTALTDYAMHYLLRKPEMEIWLQVRSDNAQAIHIYTKYGFRFDHTIGQWRHPPISSFSQPHSPTFPPNLQVTSRRPADWPQQSEWLEKNYPSNTRWYQSADFAAFSPWAWLNPATWFEIPSLQHKALRHEGQLTGVLTWKQTTLSADQIWLALPEDDKEDMAAEYLLGYLLEQFKPNRYLQMEYPAGRATKGIQNAGFIFSRNLDWMKFHGPLTA